MKIESQLVTFANTLNQQWLPLVSLVEPRAVDIGARAILKIAVAEAAQEQMTTTGDTAVKLTPPTRRLASKRSLDAVFSLQDDSALKLQGGWHLLPRSGEINGGSVIMIDFTGLEFHSGSVKPIIVNSLFL